VREVYLERKDILGHYRRKILKKAELEAREQLEVFQRKVSRDD
jgi:hypothetical protein